MLKVNTVISVPKSNNLSFIFNYRSLSILFHLSKLFEYFVQSCIHSILNNNLIYEQLGF